MNFSYPFIQRPVGTTLLGIGLLLLGIVAYRFLPVASLPTVEFPTIRVSASRPGADPALMAATVAAPLERRLGEIPGVTEITSSSSLGSTNITIQFDLNRNIDGAARDVQAALNAALTDLPGDLPTLPSFRKANPAAAPILILALTSKTMLASAIYDVADSVIAQRISQVEGVAEVTVNGAEQPAIRIRVNPVAIASMGVSMEDVRTAIANANAVGPRSAPSTGRIAAHHRHQRSAPQPRRIRHPGGEERQRQCRPAVGDRHHRAERAQQPVGGVVQRAALGAAGHHQAGRRQRDRHGGSHLRTCCRSSSAGFRPDIEFSVLSDRTLTIRASVARHAAHAGRHHRRW